MSLEVGIWALMPKKGPLPKTKNPKKKFSLWWHPWARRIKRNERTGEMNTHTQSHTHTHTHVHTNTHTHTQTHTYTHTHARTQTESCQWIWLNRNDSAKFQFWSTCWYFISHLVWRKASNSPRKAFIIFFSINLDKNYTTTPEDNAP